MARATMPVGINLNLTPSTRTKTIKTEDIERDLDKGSSPAAGIVFGLLCSAIAWMFLAYGIYRLHAMSIPIR